MATKQRLELTWIGKENRPKLEPRILLEDPAKSCHAPHRVTANDLFDNKLIAKDVYRLKKVGLGVEATHNEALGAIANVRSSRERVNCFSCLSREPGARIRRECSRSERAPRAPAKRHERQYGDQYGKRNKHQHDDRRG